MKSKYPLSEIEPQIKYSETKVRCYDITNMLPSLNTLTQEEIIITRIILERYGIDMDEDGSKKIELITNPNELFLFIVDVIRFYHRIIHNPLNNGSID